MTLIAEIHFTMTKPDADPNDVTKALRMYFDDNDLWHDPQLIMCGLTSPTQWPMSPTGDKPKITLDREGNAHKLAIVCDYEQGNYGLGFDLPTFADRLFWVLDTSPAIKITVESLVIDKDKSYVIYETDDIKPTVLHYLDKYLYGTDASLVDVPSNTLLSSFLMTLSSKVTSKNGRTRHSDTFQITLEDGKGTYVVHASDCVLYND